MTLNEYFVGMLQQNMEMLKMTVADMSDADLLVRPCPGANHGNWQLGHLIDAETQLMAAVGAKMPELPAGFADRYKGSNAIDDPKHFAPKAELMAMLERARAATIEWVKTAPAAKFDEKGPMEFTPTVASCVGMQALHVTMHLGQLQVLRRKLGKPIIF